jgi:hypothetical protein
MIKQLEIFEAVAVRDAAIQQASANAERKHPGWNEQAYQFLLDFIKDRSDPFMAEDVREAANRKKFPLPPSERAWGGVFVRAAKEGIIKNNGYAPKKKADAHRTPAILWTVKQAA